MANFLSTSDLKKVALAMVGELTDGTSEYDAKAVEYLNRIQLAILAGSNEYNIALSEPWSWGKSKYPGTLKLEPSFTDGTVSLTNNSVNGSFSSAPTESQAGKFLKISGDSEFYRIATHTASATAFTLDQAYLGDTGGGLSYNAYKLDYDTTTGILRLIAPMRAFKLQNFAEDDSGEIPGCDLHTMMREHPWHRLESGIPTRFAELFHNTDTGVYTIRFNRTVGDVARVEYDYIPIPTDLTDSGSNYPLVPRENRMVLAHGAAYHLAMDKNDSRAAEHYKNLTLGLGALVLAERRQRTNYGKRQANLIPRRDQMSTSRKYINQEIE